MKGSTVVLLGVGTALVVGGLQYRRGIDNLMFSLYDIAVGDQGAIGLAIVASNPSRVFSYPVPSLFLNVYDEDSNYLGSLRNDELQWIRANGDSLIRAWILPNYLELGSLLTHLFLPDSMDRIILNGFIKVGSISIPLDTELSVPAGSAV